VARDDGNLDNESSIDVEKAKAGKEGGVVPDKQALLSKQQQELRDLCKSRDLAVGGTKVIMSACLLIYFSACLLVCLSAYLLVCFSACLLSAVCCLRVCVSAVNFLLSAMYRLLCSDE
jgi:hypothetical protein